MDSQTFRVLHIDTEFGWRGGQQQVAYLVAGMRRLGYEAAVVCQPNSDLERYCRDRAWPWYPVRTHGEMDCIAGYRVARLCREELAADPFSGCLFLFRNRRGTAIKALVYDSRGFWLCHKRLSAGRFRFWPTRGEGGAKTLEAHQVALLLSGGDPEAGDTAPAPWRRLKTVG